jgi:tRNA/tmRNA/rRNA uracil-C5-methylase (TrmA/RlmC/RlmD family)
LIRDRTRMDLRWFKGQLGIQGAKKDSNFESEFFELKDPDTAHPGIIEMMTFFRNDPVPESLAQVRFRFHPESGNSGIWLDTSNETIKLLLDDEAWIRRILKHGWVLEMGQKGKAVTINTDGELEFKDSKPLVWLDSYSFENEPIPLLSKISHFSQPGPEANRNLIAAAYDLLDSFEVKTKSFAEFGAGYGNLTAALASAMKESSWASELDRDMSQSLEWNQKMFFSNVTVTQSKADSQVQQLNQFDLCLIDPPRPGFSEFFAGLKKLTEGLPKYFLCCHCHTRGLLGDSQSLKSLSYKLLGWSSVDIFPATQHHEVLSLWELK